MKQTRITPAQLRRYNQNVLEVRQLIQEWRERRKIWPVRLYKSLKLKTAGWYTRR